METIAIGRHLRISPLKLRKIIKILKNKSVNEALAILVLLPNKGAKIIYKVIYSAKSNFRSLFPEENEEYLMISSIFVDQSPIIRRLRMRARGRADVIRKRSSHLTVKVTLPKTEEQKI